MLYRHAKKRRQEEARERGAQEAAEIPLHVASRECHDTRLPFHAYFAPASYGFTPPRHAAYYTIIPTNAFYYLRASVSKVDRAIARARASLRDGLGFMRADMPPPSISVATTHISRRATHIARSGKRFITL